MQIEPVTVLKSWPEFILEPPSETLINHLRMVCETTLVTGQKRYSEKTQLRLITCVASLGYGPAFYEAVHLIAVLARLQIGYTNLFVQEAGSSSGFVKSLLLDRQLPEEISFNDKHICLQYKDKHGQFNLHLSRISVLAAVLEFVYQTLGFELLNNAWDSLSKHPMEKDYIDQASRDLSAAMYSYLQDHLPAPAIRAKAKQLCDYLTQHKTGKTPHYEDITDELILAFWVEKSQDEKLRLKLFSSAVESWMRYRQAMRMAGFSGFVHPESLNQMIDHKDRDMLEFHHVQHSYADQIDESSTYGDLITSLSAQDDNAIKYLNKKELKFLQPFCAAEQESQFLFLTLFRQQIFSPVQAILVEASRKQGQKDGWEEQDRSVRDNAYAEVLAELQKMAEQCIALAKIGCLRLWEEENPHAFALMLTLCDEADKSYIQQLAQTHAQAIKGPVDITQRAQMIAQSLLQSDDTTLIRIKRDFSSAARKYKRSGLVPAAPDMPDEQRSDWHIRLAQGAEALIELHQFLSELGNRVQAYYPGHQILSSQLRNDKPIFMKNFTALYGQTTH